MSDFSNFWSYWIIAITVGGIVFCLAILVAQMRGKVNKPGETDLKPHVWDDTLQEYNNPMPRWWIYMFVGTIIFSCVYLWAYPGLGSYKGAFAWSTADEHQKESDELDAKSAELYKKYLSTPIPELAENKDAMKLGERIFQNNCAQCHGTTAEGSKGFPNLTDSDWLYGGFPDAIGISILGGRNGIMTPQAEALKSPAAVNDVANYVLSLSGSSHDAVAAARGQEKFTLCATCHMPDGQGSYTDKSLANFGVGAPNLTDKTWLYGGNLKTITETITNGRNNVMPAWECSLGHARIHVLTAYVWQLNRDQNDKVLNPTQAPDYMAAEVQKNMKMLDGLRQQATAKGESACLAVSLHEMIRKQNADKAKGVDAQNAAAAAKPAAEDAKK